MDQGIESDTEIDWKKVKNTRNSQENKFRYQIVIFNYYFFLMYMKKKMLSLKKESQLAGSLAVARF